MSISRWWLLGAEDKGMWVMCLLSRCSAHPLLQGYPPLLREPSPIPYLPLPFVVVVEGKHCRSVYDGSEHPKYDAITFKNDLAIIKLTEQLHFNNKTLEGVFDVTEYMVCAGYEEGGTDVCESNTGSPLTCYAASDPYLAGLVSWQYGCARPFRPPFYTNLVYFIH
ncbi:hypothetical protein O3P69_000741 [Scylla paramamosain]|uniref:Peptidase S1 domain-containing protein n=1 Tax=Scylla paramamosain TaxID=85552 RepID=A0AAW0UW37_SCYPA